jgi:hypothetical protein
VQKLLLEPSNQCQVLKGPDDKEYKTLSPAQKAVSGSEN